MRSVSLLLMLVALAGCGSPSAPTAPRERLARVETTAPAVESLPIRVELTATVEPLYRVDVCARVNGVVAEFFPANLDIGQRVLAGAPVLRLAVPELEAQREQRLAALSQAKNQVEQATEAERVAGREVTEAELQLKRHAADVKFRQLETKRVTDLAAKGAIQPERVEEAERQLEATQAAFEAARAAVETKKAKQGAAKADFRTAESRVAVAAADLKTTEEMIALATVKAPSVEGLTAGVNNATPFYYVVSRRLVDRGATVKDAAQPLLTLMHTDTVRVLVDIPERDVPLLEAIVKDAKTGAGPSDQVLLKVPSLRESSTRGEYRGRIARTASVLDPATRTMRAEVEFDNRSGELRPGMFGAVTLTLGTRPNAMILPSSAFVRRDGRTEVLVVDSVAGNSSRGVVRVVPVEVGYDDGKRVQVTSGLTGKERVVVRGNTPVGAGDPVIPVEVRSR
jgi:RND family efflux transporter MFP subunit